MSDDNVVPFRRRSLPPENGVLRFGDGCPPEGVLITECDDVMHLFSTVPGRCQCGQRHWDDLSEPPTDVSA